MHSLARDRPYRTPAELAGKIANRDNAILNTFARGIGVRGIARELHIPKSTVSRVVSSAYTRGDFRALFHRAQVARHG